MNRKFRLSVALDIDDLLMECIPYAIKLADMGWEAACRADAGLAKGLNVVDGKVTFPGVAEAFGMECHAAL